MWRALFWAIGLYAILLGAQFMLIDRAVLHEKAPQQGAFTAFRAQSGRPLFRAQSGRPFVPPEWAPWSLITFGIITLIYSFTIPRRVGE